jgi:hypothetical protein
LRATPIAAITGTRNKSLVLVFLQLRGQRQLDPREQVPCSTCDQLGIIKCGFAATQTADGLDCGRFYSADAHVHSLTLRSNRHWFEVRRDCEVGICYFADVVDIKAGKCLAQDQPLRADIKYGLVGDDNLDAAPAGEG